MTQKEHADEEGRTRVQSAVDLFLDRTRAVVELMASAGSGAFGAMPERVPATVARMLTSMRQLVDQLPPVTAEIDILIEEVHAKRLSIQALQAELTALDNQLEVLERTLAPVEAWSRQWNRISKSISQTLDADTAPGRRGASGPA